MKEKQTLSVVLPIYNCGKFLKEAIESIQNQTFKDFECLLCDATTDGSSDFLHNFCQKDARFILISQQPSLPDQLQEGLEKAKSPLIARMDADDISLPHRFEWQLSAMKKHPDLILLGGGTQYIDENGKRGKKEILPRSHKISDELLWGCPLAHPTVMFKRDAVLSVGGYRKNFVLAEDYDLWLRLLDVGKIDNLQKIVLLYRFHGDNSVIVGAQQTRYSVINAQSVYILKKYHNKHVEDSDVSNNIENVLSLLTHKERIHVLARVMANFSHLIGDAHEDKEGASWLEEIKKEKLDPILKKALAMYYMRCAKRYIKNNSTKSIKYLGQSFKYDSLTSIHMIYKQMMKHL